MGYYQVNLGATWFGDAAIADYYYRKEFDDLSAAKRFAAEKMREHGYGVADVYDEGSGKWYLERIVEES